MHKFNLNHHHTLGMPIGKDLSYDHEVNKADPLIYNSSTNSSTNFNSFYQLNETHVRDHSQHHFQILQQQQQHQQQQQQPVPQFQHHHHHHQNYLNPMDRLYSMSNDYLC